MNRSVTNGHHRDDRSPALRFPTGFDAACSLGNAVVAGQEDHDPPPSKPANPQKPTGRLDEAAQTRHRPAYHGVVTEDALAEPPSEPFPGLAEHDLIHLGGRTAVVVPVEEFQRLRHAALHARFLQAKATGETERFTVEEFIERTGLPEAVKQELRAIPGTR